MSSGGWVGEGVQCVGLVGEGGSVVCGDGWVRECNVWGWWVRECNVEDGWVSEGV